MRRPTDTTALLNDLDQVVQKMLACEKGWGVQDLMRMHHLGYPTVYAIVRPRFTHQQWWRMAKQRRIANGMVSRFRKGQVPWNLAYKGIHLSPATEFKPGCLRGRAARNLKAVGSITIHCRRNHTPSRWIKIRDHGPPKGRWMELSRYLWQRAHGPLAPGLLVVHLDGNPLHDDLANYLPMSRAESIRHERQIGRMTHHGDRVAAVKKWRKSMAIRREIKRAAEQKARENPTLKRWECPACGADFGQSKEPPARCPKCGASRLELIEIPLAARPGQEEAA